MENNIPSFYHDSYNVFNLKTEKTNSWCVELLNDFSKENKPIELPSKKNWNKFWNDLIYKFIDKLPDKYLPNPIILGGEVIYLLLKWSVDYSHESLIIKYVEEQKRLKLTFDPMLNILMRLGQMEKELLPTIPIEVLNKVTKGKLDSDSFVTYERLVNIMVNEYHYNMVETKKDQFGFTYWTLIRTKTTDDNKDMNETYEIKHEYNLQEINSLAR